jgi:Flp pilus assembly pilin Flp
LVGVEVGATAIDHALIVTIAKVIIIAAGRAVGTALNAKRLPITAVIHAPAH